MFAIVVYQDNLMPAQVVGKFGSKEDAEEHARLNVTTSYAVVPYCEVTRQ